LQKEADNIEKLEKEFEEGGNEIKANGIVN
jgi:hypothetical protein